MVDHGTMSSASYADIWLSLILLIALMSKLMYDHWRDL